MSEEPRYVSLEDDDSAPHTRPKWMKPDTTLAKRALAICGRKYYQKHEKSRWIMIEKAMMPLASGAISVYPSEWVEQVLSWAEKKNKERIVIIFPALLKALSNEDRINDFVAQWQNKHKDDMPDESKPIVEKTVDNAEEFGWDF